VFTTVTVTMSDGSLKFVGARGAGVAELVDALDLGSSDANRGGSSPPARTIGQSQDGEEK
jgi:hypothetical protein